MVLPFKKILSKFEIPKNDWVLSRFGGCEPPSNPAASDDSGLVEEDAPVSQAPSSVAARLLNRLLDISLVDDATVPPQSGARVSSNASEEEVISTEDHESRAS